MFFYGLVGISEGVHLPGLADHAVHHLLDEPAGRFALAAVSAPANTGSRPAGSVTAARTQTRLSVFCAGLVPRS